MELQMSASGPVPDAGGETMPRYEFTSDQNEVMASLGRAMRDVGRYLGAIGILSLIIGVARLIFWSVPWQGALATTLWSLLQGGIFVLMGVWTHAAGDHFQRVAATTGADIQHLMGALGEVRHVYGLARVVTAAGLALLVLAMLLLLSRTAL